MNLPKSPAEVYVPDGAPVDLALARVTHLGIGAHQDDLEFMAFHGITECFGRSDCWFGGVTCTDGAGSSRSGNYAKLSDAEMAELRRKEQNEAARVGNYSAMIQLGHPSARVREERKKLAGDLLNIFQQTRPEVVYTHNLADKHPTHVAVALATIEALRSLPKESRPRRVIGCEGWRDLDWLSDNEKVVMDVSGHEGLAAKLATCFASQIESGKRYDLAVAGRRAANATFADPHSIDCATQVIYGMDLTPLMTNDSLDPALYAEQLIGRFRDEVVAALRSSA